ncbi:MAG: UDP-2,3-diacylglucosamine diphosphatase LpxI [Nitrospirae bacterium]|nr:UDP-2,3-diacylglucosamine diphosphatase LpxI [Nitrospirota bacterium]
MTQKLGIIAGDGSFPVILAEAAKNSGYSIIVAAHNGITSPDIEKAADKTFWFNLGQLSKMIDSFKKEGVREAIMAGGVSKKFMFKDVRPDLRSISLLFRLKDRKDDTILRAIAGEFEKDGIKIGEATAYITSILAEKGVMTNSKPTDEEQKDIEFGMEMAKGIGRLDIGQCIIVKNRAVLAVEAVEGTDETIRRGGRFADGGATVVKICKPGQDLRFDLPTIGTNTIETMKEVNARVLAVESGMTIILEKEKLIRSADEAGICVIGI